MSASSRTIDRVETTFDHPGLVANAGLIVAATLMTRLGLESLIGRWVRTGCPNPAHKMLTTVAAMLVGGTHIDHVDMLRAGSTRKVLGFTVAAPSTVGTWLRSFTFGHVRQLDAVLSRTLARAGKLGAGPGRLLSLFAFDGPWDNWEIHPNGDEIVLLLEGAALMTLEGADGQTDTVRLDSPGSFVLIARGTWHTARTDTQARMLFITDGEGTRHRPV